MRHDIALEDWIDYLDESLEESKRLRLDAHLLSCSACRETYETMRNVEARLRLEGAELEAVGMRSSPGARLPLGAATHNLPEHLFTTLTSILAAICGTETSERIWRAAGRRASAEPAAGLASERSTLLRHLRSITGSLCGEDAARLIWEVGNQMEGSEV